MGKADHARDKSDLPDLLPQGSIPPPVCSTCEGKGYVSPDDAGRAVEAASAMYMAGYEHGQRMADPSAQGSIPQVLDKIESIRLTAVQSGTFDARLRIQRLAEEATELLTALAVPPTTNNGQMKEEGSRVDKSNYLRLPVTTAG
jgi:hypothetical protein